MTEAEWRTSTDPQAMYALLQESTTLMRTRWQGWVPVRAFRFSNRRELLFRCAVCAGLVDIVRSEPARRLIEHLRRRQFDDGPALATASAESPMVAFLAALQQHHPRATDAAWEALRSLTYLDRFPPSDWLDLAAYARAEFLAPDGEVWLRAPYVLAERTAQADLLREFAGNPFREPDLPADWPTWRDGLLVNLARRIGREEDFAALPVLGDALEDASCIDADVLDHCRQDKPHQRGCWVVELLLGRE